MCPNRVNFVIQHQSPEHFNSNDVVAVIGASHSGLLALKTLYQMKDRPKKIYVL